MIINDIKIELNTPITYSTDDDKKHQGLLISNGETAMVHILEQTDTEVVKQLDNTGNKKRIGIMGGTFNPPHLGHLVMADQVLNQLGLDRILFMPDAKPPHIDHKLTIATQDRIRMVADSISPNQNFGMELSEVTRGGVSYTYDTMVYLKKRHPEIDYYFIVGGDMVAYFPKWYRIDDLIKLVQFVGVKRNPYPIKTFYPVIWVDTPVLDISSTMIRNRVFHKQSIKYLVTDPVSYLIRERGLYRD